MIHCQVSKYLSVEVNPGLLDFPHKFGIRHSVKASSRVNTGDPDRSEFSFLLLSVAVGINQSFFDSILCNGPDIFLTTEETLREFQNPFSLSP